MPSGNDYHEALRDQYKSDSDRLIELDKQLNELRPKFVKYKDLSNERSEVEQRIRVLLAIFGYLLPGEELRDLYERPGVQIESPDKERDQTSLWRVLREIIRQVSEIRIVDLEAVLKQYRFKVSRQAIESAIETHKKTFRSERKGRERFVSLK